MSNTWIASGRDPHLTFQWLLKPTTPGPKWWLSSPKLTSLKGTLSIRTLQWFSKERGWLLCNHFYKGKIEWMVMETKGKRKERKRYMWYELLVCELLVINCLYDDLVVGELWQKKIVILKVELFCRREQWNAYWCVSLG